MKQPASVQRFFSDVGPTSGPFELLGVDPLTCVDDDVKAALKRRLDRLAMNPQAATPEAEEVRLALHVAAAQLLDPHVRAQLIEEHRFARTAPPREEPPPPAALDTATLSAIAAAGGWNNQARQRLVAMASSQGVPPRQAAARLAQLAGAGQPAPAPAANPPLDSAILREDPAIIQRRALRRWAAFAMLLLLIASTVLIADRLVAITRQIEQLPAAAADESEDAPRADAAIDAHNSPVPEAASRTGAAPSPIITPSRHPSTALKEPADPAPAPRPALAEPVAEFLAHADTILINKREGEAPIVRLARAVQLARLNLAARRLWTGDQPGAERALQSADRPPYAPTSPLLLEHHRDPAALTSPGIEPDGALALEIWALRRQPGHGVEAFRNRRFTHLSLGPVDCDAVADTALFGSPQDLRLVARRIVGDQRENPSMVNALLEALPRASRQSPLSSLIAEVSERTLPEIDDPAWPVRARAALVERLAELLAPGARPGVDALAEMLTAAYSGRDADSVSESLSGLSPPGPMREADDAQSAPQPQVLTGPIPTGDSRGAEAAAESLRATWLSEANAYRALRSAAERIDAANRDHAARSGLAQGPIQRFLAAQSTIVDLMSIVVEEEHPAVSLDDVLEATRSARSASTHIFAQIEANEEAMTRLWMTRFTGESEAATQ